MNGFSARGDGRGGGIYREGVGLGEGVLGGGGLGGGERDGRGVRRLGG